MSTAPGEHEQTYLADVRRRLRDVPATQRRGLLGQASDHLAERPPAASLDQLLRAIGSPKLYAEELRSASGIPARVGNWRRFVGQRRRFLLAEIIASSALLVGSLIAWSWFTAVPELWNSCSGSQATQVDIRRAAGHTEYVLTFEAQTRVGILLCLNSRDKGISIEGIRTNTSPVSAIQPVGVEVRHAQGRFSGNTGSFVPFDPTDWPRSGAEMLWFEWEYCGFYGPGSGISISSATIDYRYRWRRRSMQVDLRATYSALVQECRDSSGDALAPNEARARDESISRQWQASAGRFDNRFADIGPIRLYPESISRDLCRFLRGVPTSTTNGGYRLPGATESLEDRAVFNLARGHHDLAIRLIDGAVGGVCPEFATRRDELVSMVDPDLVVPDDSP